MMMRRGPLAAMGLAWLLGSGCTTLREIPRADYTAQPERRHVRLWTDEGLVYEFDYVRVSGDTIVGYRQRDVEGSIDEFATLSVPLHEVARLSARKVDWSRTGLIGVGLVAAVVTAGLSSGSGESSSGGGGGGKGDPIGGLP